jgi:hypothetical protein
MEIVIIGRRIRWIKPVKELLSKEITVTLVENNYNFFAPLTIKWVRHF